ncbi:uncharacterized protein I303_105291 [Kwoniella dejecticola CBS 10117]|uniref:C2H2-type domain-containing protein n=1 Tax=Kwoniella dejecticola CBS 10117 TaxID=1296121 RepID=A0A1A6A2X5_9TREE|nr:uncharacterized protein I303_05261 [Kwoniella dejecticola CBS 10117]OBR84403.1 hypothetical protein I303_05261 [Kwoniella dejecticola CBS 10117]
MPFQQGPRKAEKDEQGNTVYPCLWIGCKKAFGTAGHVRRHEKTHVGITPYACPHCDKSFNRSDVRAKHVSTMHPEREGQGGSSSSGMMDDLDERPAKIRRLSIDEDSPNQREGNSSTSKSEEGHSRRYSTSSDHRRPSISEITHPQPHPHPQTQPQLTQPFNTFISPLSTTIPMPVPVQVSIPSNQPASDQHQHQNQPDQSPTINLEQLWSTFNTDPSTNANLPDSFPHTGLTPITNPLAANGPGASPNVGMSGSGPAGMSMMPPPQVNTGTPFSVPSVGSSNSGFIDPAHLSVGTSAGLGDFSTDLFGAPLPPGPPLDPFDPSWEWFGHVFGWGSDENIDLDIGLQSSMFDKAGVGPISSTDSLSAAWLLCSTPRGGSPVNGEDPTNSTKSASLMPDPFGRKDDTLWPNVFKPKVPDRPLTLAGVKATSSKVTNRNKIPLDSNGIASKFANGVNETSRNAMLSLIYLSHQPHWMIPDVEDFPDAETMSDFVDLYFENFHPLFPIVHKPTFFNGDTPAVLLLSVAAIGATYANKEFGPLAVALCELVRRMIAWMRGSDQRAKFDRNTLLAFLLQTALGIACGSREMYYHAEIFRCSIVTTCRRLHLLRGIGSAMNDLHAREDFPTDDQRYKAYMEDETKRRLGWGVYYLDSQMVALLHIPAVFAVNEAGIHLPCDDALWEAPDAASWAALIANKEAADPYTTRPKFLKVLAKSLAGEDIGTKMDDLGCAIISLTVWRMLLDQQMLQKALGVGLTDNGMDKPSYTHEAHVLETKPAHLLLRLAQTTYLSPSPSHLRLTPAALYHSAYIQFTRPGLMDRIRHVSGKYEPDMTTKGSLGWLKAWMKDGKEVRKVLWHAGVLNALLAEFSRGSFAELFWTFDCALVVWAIVKYAPHQITKTNQGLRSALFAANWFDTVPPNLWIAHGGEIVFPFLGSSANWTVSNLLELFMNRLEAMRWGLAVQYKLVLNTLLEAEKVGKTLAVDGGRPNKASGEGKEDYTDSDGK